MKIRAKLFVVFMAGIVGFLALGIVLNFFCLEPYTVYKNKSLFVGCAEQIEHEYDKNPNGIEDVIRQVDRTEGISCIVADRDFNILYTSFSQRAGKSVMPSELTQPLRASKNLKAGSLYQIVETPDYKEREIAYFEKLGDGYLILRKPIRFIAESAQISVEFFVVSGVLILFLGGMGMFVVSGRIAKPVVAMNGIAKNIAKLNFSQRVPVQTRDEIGELAESVNQIAQELSSSMDALRNDVERRKMFVRNLSHELKTPIGVIKGYSEGLLYGVADDPQKVAKYCGIIRNECDRMNEMVQELLMLSQLEAGLFPMRMEKLALEDLIYEVLERFAPMIDEVKADVLVQCNNGLSIEADRELIGRVLANYLTNALHHLDEQRQIKMDALRQDEEIVLSVFNSGIVLAEEERSRIWDVFYKADKAHSRQYGGNGLGLSIVAIIAQLHGGNCGCENAVRDGVPGVQFFVKIPVERSLEPIISP